MKGSWDNYELDDDDEDYEELSEPEGVAMKANGDDYELDDDDEDYEELSEGVHGEKPRVWLASSFSSAEIASLAENKGDIEMLADMRGVVNL